jgi:hypothetical protein
MFKFLSNSLVLSATLAVLGGAIAVPPSLADSVKVFQGERRVYVVGPNRSYYRGPNRVYYNGVYRDYYRGPKRVYYNGVYRDYYRGPNFIHRNRI